MLEKDFRMLRLRSVAGIRMHHELGIRQVLGQDLTCSNRPDPHRPVLRFWEKSHPTLRRSFLGGVPP